MKGGRTEEKREARKRERCTVKRDKERTGAQDERGTKGGTE